MSPTQMQINSVRIPNGAIPATPPPNTGIFSNEDVIGGLWERYRAVKGVDEVKNGLVEDLLNRYDHLLRKHNDYVEEHKQERELSATQIQREKLVHNNIMHLQRLLNRDGYVMVLIDADGMIFHSALLKAGEAGGKEAASILHDAVVQWAVADVAECPADIKVAVRAYGNLKGLADICFRAGLVDSPDKVKDFARGFTRGKPLFDFLGVGEGRRADGKIIETLKLHLFDYQCRQVLLGCSHDIGFARMLHTYDGDQEVQTRLTLLEGIPFEKEFTSLKLNTKKFPELFRETQILGQMDLLGSMRGRVDSRNSVLNGASGVFTPRTSTPAAGVATVYPSRGASLGSASAVSSTPEPNPNMWSVVTAKNAHRPLIDKTRHVVEPAQTVTRNQVKRNKHGERIDIELDYNRDDVQRIKKLKSCNQHYIGIGCCHYNAGKADKCPHAHHYKFSVNDLKTLRVVARETPCKKGHECDDVNCIYGHQCPFPLATEGSMRGIGCLNGEYCRFPRSMHNMDLIPVKTTRIGGCF